MIEHNVAKQEIKYMIVPLTDMYLEFCKENKVPVTKKNWVKFLGVHRSTLNEWRNYGGELKESIEAAIKKVDKEDRETKKAEAAKKQGYKMNKKGHLTKTGYTKEEIADMENRVGYINEIRKKRARGEYDLTNIDNVISAIDSFFDSLIVYKDEVVKDEKTGEKYTEKVIDHMEIPTLPLLALYLGMTTSQLKTYNPSNEIGELIRLAKQYIETESLQGLVNNRGSYVGIMFAMKNGFGYIDKVNQQIDVDKSDIQKLTDEELDERIKKVEMNEYLDFKE